MVIEGKKASILLVLKTLEEYSDEEHFLTYQQIIDLISKNYDVELERKSIANSIAVLQDLDYEIEKGPKGGFALFSRTLDRSEVSFLVDAIFSSKSVPGKEAKKLADKVSSCLSKHDRKSYDYLVKSEDISRTDNKEVFYNIEIISEAIRKNKWVGFRYREYNKDGERTTRFHGYVYHCSPCYLISNYGHYYLIAYRPKYDSVATYRIDFMQDVEIMTERERLDPKEMKEFKNYKSISEYLNEHIYLFGGDAIKVKMKVLKGSSLSAVYDWFGNNAKVRKENDELIAEVRCDEQAFFYWALQYEQDIQILEPQSMIDKLKDAAQKISEKYK